MQPPQKLLVLMLHIASCNFRLQKVRMKLFKLMRSLTFIKFTHNAFTTLGGKLSFFPNIEAWFVNIPVDAQTNGILACKKGGDDCPYKSQFFTITIFLLQHQDNLLTGLQRKKKPATSPLHAWDEHTECVTCLGFIHAEAALITRA